MIKSYLLIGLRNLRKHLSYSLINILGLGLGLATCLLLVTWIRHEVSFDRFHAGADRMYMAKLEVSSGGQAQSIPQTPNKLLAELRASYPAVETGVRVYDLRSFTPFAVQYKDALFQEKRFGYADSTFFQVFTFRLLKGNPNKALAQRFSVVISEATAKKYFGDEDPIGKMLRVNDARDYTVTGVMENIPSNSSIQLDLIGSFNSVAYGVHEPAWFPANFLTFIKLNDKASLGAMAQQLNEQVKKELAGEIKGEGDYIRFGFTPLRDLHLNESGQKTYVYIFSAVALLILIIACINYVNLSTARAADRAREVGIRKVAGAQRLQLFVQFIGESLLITLLAFITALVLAWGMLPVFNSATGLNFSPWVFFDATFMIPALLVLAVIGILSGTYPALAISALRPASILKGSYKFSGKGIWLRRSLVIVQFTISITLIVGTLVIYKQLVFIRDKEIGYNKANTFILPLDHKTQGLYDQLKTELIKSGSVSHVSRASESPVNIQGGYSIYTEGPERKIDLNVTALTVDTDFIATFGMTLIAGRNFTEGDFAKVKADTTRRSSSFILNETAVKGLGLDPEKAIGTRMRLSGRWGEIVGVVGDFHFASMHKRIEPLVLFNEVEQFGHMFIHINAGDTRANIQAIERICRQVIPHRPFEYTFADQDYAALYAAEERMGSVFIGFASLAIIIACLGLLGLVSFSAAQRTKEIGIRKVLGATPAGIVVLITKDFTRLIVVAIVLGLPLAYYIMTQWLGDFAYKTDIGLTPLVAAPAICLVIAFATSAFQALKAAMVDPANTLRNE
jgi:putative ABC transport system permease protein